MNRPLAALAFTLSLGACADSLTPAEFNDEAHRARACSPGDTCAVFLSPRACLCPWGVRASELARLEALATKVDCGDAHALCVDVPPEPACVNGTCDGVAPAVDAGAAGAGGD